MHSRSRFFAAAAVACAALAACHDNPAAPREVPEGELLFARAAADAPPLETLQKAVWARVGEGRRVEIAYKPTGSYGGDRCLEFDIPGDALWKRPDGTLYQRGDSVLITVTVENPALFRFRFEPSGLQFNPRHPAELRISYKWADPDVNGDGRVDDRDRRLTFGVWRQEASAAPWSSLRTERDDNIEDTRVDVLGFTRYALAAD